MLVIYGAISDGVCGCRQGLTAEYGAVDNDESEGDDNVTLRCNAILTLSNGVPCPVFGEGTPSRKFTSNTPRCLCLRRSSSDRLLVRTGGVDVWTDQDCLVRWDWAPPEIFKGIDADGRRIPFPFDYPELEFSEFSYLADSIRSMLRTIADPSLELYVSGEDVSTQPIHRCFVMHTFLRDCLWSQIRASLEVATAVYQSATGGSVPMSLPLVDRVNRPFYPRPYRWLGGDASGLPQAVEDIAARAEAKL